MEKLALMIKELTENKFYGEILIKFEAGKIIICKKTECIKYIEE